MTRKAKKWLSALAIGLITLTIGVTQYDLDSGWAALSSRLNDRLMAMFVDVAGFQKTGVRITFATESSARLPSRINDRWFQAFASCGSGQTCLRVVDVTGGAASAPVDAQYVTLALDATLSAERVLTGTTDQIIITDGGANTTVTLSTPQDIAATSSPTFASLSLNDAVNQIVLDADGANTGTITLAALSLARTYTFPNASGEISLLGQTIDLTTEVTGTLPVGNGGMGATSHTDGAILLGNAAGAITNLGVLADDTLVLGDGVTDPGTATVPDCDAVDDALNYDVTTNAFSCQSIATGAPTGASYVVLGLDATLTAERVLTGTTDQIIITDGGANTTVTLSLPQDIALTSSPTFASLSLNDAVNQIVLDADEGSGFTGTITLDTLAAARTYTFPDASGEVSLLGQLIDLTTEVTGTLPVGNGGMGATSHTDGAILLGNAAGAITNLGVLADDTLVLGDGVTDPGTALLPDCNAVDEAINYDVPTNTFSCQTIVGSAAGAPTGASYVVLGLDATLTAERVLTGTTDQIIITDGGANTTVTLSLPQDIAITSSPSFASVNIDNRLNHTSDLDTFIDFNADEIEIEVGGIFFARLTEAVTDVFTINPNAGDVNFIVETLTVIDALTIDAGADTAAFNVPLTTNNIFFEADNTFDIGTSTVGPRIIFLADSLQHANNTGTKISFGGNLIQLQVTTVNAELTTSAFRVNPNNAAGMDFTVDTDIINDAFFIDAGAETAAFNVPLTVNNIFVETDSTFDIGTTTVRVREIFTDAITITGASLKLSADGGAGDVILARDASNILALRNGTTAQEFRIYNTFTDASNYERTAMQWTSNIYEVFVESAGTGAVRSMKIGTESSGASLTFRSSGTDRWAVASNGNLLTLADNAYSIGLSSSNRPSNIFAATLLAAPTLNLTATTNQIVLDSDTANTGTITMAALGAARVFTLPDATVTLAGLEFAQEYTSQQNFNATTLTDAANISWNLETNQVTSVTLAGNRTLDNPTNLVDGATYLLIVKQDVTGSRTLAYGTAYKFPGGTAPVLSTGTLAVDIITFVSDGTNMFGVIIQDFS